LGPVSLQHPGQCCILKSAKKGAWTTVLGWGNEKGQAVVPLKHPNSWLQQSVREWGSGRKDERERDGRLIWKGRGLLKVRFKGRTKDGRDKQIGLRKYI